MPEGHTIHRIARDHGRLLAGRAVAVSSPQGRFDDSSIVDGRVLERIEAYGKHLFYWWEGDAVVHVHLGLFGTFRVHEGAGPVEPGGAVRMRLVVDRATIDLAGPSDCSLGDVSTRHSIVARLGPDPLRRDADPERFTACLGRTKRPIGAALLDQSVVAGVGNVYRAEALFVNGIDPDRPANELTDVEVRALWSTIAGMLRRGVRDNRIITIDRSDLPRGRAKLRRGESTYVYRRHECLRCGSPIRWYELANRTCYACPVCQPA
jgi:formamidopyrimidine-DNA glycosylase